MADNIPEAFQALHERWEAIVAREQARFAAVNQDLPVDVAHAVEVSRTQFQEAVAGLADDRYMRDAVHDPEYLAMMAGRSIGDDGPDEVRLAREDGPAPGSLAAVQADLQLEDNRAREVREYDEEHPTVLDRVESLQARLNATGQQQPERQQGQDMGY